MSPSREIEKLQRRWQENPLGLTFAPLAEAYRKEGRFPDALELLNLGLVQHPQYVPAHIVKGRCFLDTQADQSAEAAFLKVADLDPENVIALQSLAEIAERAGRYDEAVARLERLLAFDRTNEDASANLDRLRMILAMPQPGQVVLEADSVLLAEPDESTEPEDDVIPADPSEDLVALDGLAEAEVVSEAEPEEEPPTAAVVSVSVDEMTVQVYQPIELTSNPSPDFQVAGDAERLDPGAAMGRSETAADAEILSVEADDAEAVAGVEAEPELVVTETMAELFLRQGHSALALAVYTQLAGRDPENQRIQGAIAHLRAELEPGGPAPGLPGFAAVLTGGQSVRGLFEQLLAAVRPAAENVDGLSLGAVFDGGAGPAGPDAATIGPGPSYDEFYADDAAEPVTPLVDASDVEEEGSPDDLEGFTSWLKGLKR